MTLSKSGGAARGPGASFVSVGGSAFLGLSPAPGSPANPGGGG